MLNTKTISNEYWLNARVSYDYRYNNLESRFHGISFNIEFLSGIWYDGVWYNGVWSRGNWLNGTWNLGAIWDSPSFANIKISTISPKVYFKPKNTLSLNRAKYGDI